MLVASFPSGAALLNRQCTLSQVGTHRDMTLDVARMQNNNKQIITISESDPKPKITYTLYFTKFVLIIQTKLTKDVGMFYRLIS